MPRLKMLHVLFVPGLLVTAIVLAFRFAGPVGAIAFGLPGLLIADLLTLGLVERVIGERWLDRILVAAVLVASSLNLLVAAVALSQSRFASSMTAGLWTAFALGCLAWSRRAERNAPHTI
jgi:hypothetical protein